MTGGYNNDLCMDY